jgi:(p)ppGpp synthase/HD superfamily hydrolase
MDPFPLYSPLIERALRLAATAHQTQCRKGTDVPYVTHPVQTAWILLRAGFTDDHLLAAALLHDAVEDAGVTLDELREQFPAEVVETVAAVTERKHDEHGRKRSWEDRKREHLAEIASASLAARALTLADKLHNLETLAADLNVSADVWGRFNAPPDRLLWYYREMTVRAAGRDERLCALADACRDVLRRIEELPR